MAKPLTGILLLNYGAPSSLDDVQPFLSHIFAGKPVLPAVLDSVRRRYQQIGGGSPLLANSCRVASGLAARLRSEDENILVRVAMLHTVPYIGDVVAEMAAAGVQRIVAVSMAPFYSHSSSGAYFLAAASACRDHSLPLYCLDGWHLHPLYLQAVRETMAAGLGQIRQPSGTVLVFSAHSLPLGDDAPAYQAQFTETVASVVRGYFTQPCRQAYQSRGGGSSQWLGPSLAEVLEELAGSGSRSVLVVPIGFAVDHLETLYDLDIDAAGQARGLGLIFHRCPALNDHPLFIRALAERIEDYLRKEIKA